jgi:pyruvate dehydrogenase E2 component (dihydrolipoyllysine-residue acetyltransferase)
LLSLSLQESENMAEITMPKLSDTMTEGVLVRWLKKKGDVVSMGDVLAEVETDKATMEMEAFHDGLLKETYVEEGQKVAVGERIALIVAEGEEAASPLEKVTKVAAFPKRRVDEKKPVVPRPQPAEIQQVRELAHMEEGYSQAPKRRVEAQRVPLEFLPAPPGGRVKASPLARKIAARLKVDLSRIEGTGPGGRIVQEDVLAAAQASKVAPVSEPVADTVSAAPVVQSELITLSPMRRVIAQRMVESKTQIPHFYLNVELDVGALLKLRDQANENLKSAGEGKLSINDFVLKASVEALKRAPQVNASFTENGILRYYSVDLGLAVSLDEGLIVPVIRNAGTKSLRQISAEARDLIERARARKLKPEDYEGGTFTVTNLGPSGIDSFLGIINPPQVAILAVGSVLKKPVVVANDQIVVGQRMNVTLCCDHRAVDGATAALFLQELRKMIENPTLMLL